MSWMFVVDIVFFALLGILMFPLGVLMVAYIRNISFDNAYVEIRSFLAKWMEIQSQGFLDYVFKGSGITATLLILGFGAYIANRIGDETITDSVAVFGYFDNEVVRWSVENKEEWKNMKFNFREVTEINSDRLKWEQAKADMGKYDSRFFRTAAVVFFAATLGSIVALCRRRAFWSTGSAFLVFMFATLVNQWLWVEREQKYIENLVSRYASAYARSYGKPLQKPASYEGWWPEFEVMPGLERVAQSEKK